MSIAYLSDGDHDIGVEPPAFHPPLGVLERIKELDSY
jgi:hypothetical protein